MKNVLTCTTQTRTISDMDATAQQLLEKLTELERQAESINQKIYSIKTALELIGIRPEDRTPFDEGMDSAYARMLPFLNTSLVEACKRVLMDHKRQALTKSQIEYFAGVGGYRFATDDSKNSVDVTLRRLVAQGCCAVDRNRGPHGNRYIWISERDSIEEKGEADAAATNDSRKQ